MRLWMVKCFINWKAPSRSTEYHITQDAQATEWAHTFACGTLYLGHLRQHPSPNGWSFSPCKVLGDLYSGQRIWMCLRIPMGLIRENVANQLSVLTCGFLLSRYLETALKSIYDGKTTHHQTRGPALGQLRANTSGKEGNAIYLIYKWEPCGSESWSYLLVVMRQLSGKALRFAWQFLDKVLATFAHRGHFMPFNLGNSWPCISEHLPENTCESPGCLFASNK